MNNHLFASLVLPSILPILCVLIAIPSSYSDDGEACSGPNHCGQHIPSITYPFWGDDINRPRYCGREAFELKCHDNQYLTIQFENQNFRILDINITHPQVTIARDDFFDNNICRGIFKKTVINRTLYNYSPNVRNLSFYHDCSGDWTSPGQNNFSCLDGVITGFYTIDDYDDPRFYNRTSTCKSVIKIPILLIDPLNIDDLLTGKLIEALKRGFEVEYLADNESCKRCESSLGICGSNQYSDEFACLCRDKSQCSGKKKDVLLKVVIGIGAAVAGMGIMAAIFIIGLRHKKKFFPSSFFSCNTSSDTPSKVDLEKGDDFPGVHVFTYTELEEATNYFDSSKELGDGGFGTVYYGKLQDGRGVAVKRLYENNYRRVEQFMNEVEILARLRHQNLVSLYGCTSRHSRELLLVYEYIPNGTVADHLHGGRAKPGEVPWPTRLKIAIETASALTYLHASDIIHRDVKTNNILLDNNFCVKVADFGLSRLFPLHVTHVSTAPQGTPGYVDPEYHQCYQLTDKSDVFSFGVVLIELISSMPAVDITRHRHEINLSNLAINKIQNKALHELVDSTLGYESDYKVRKMINSVAELAFQCLQSEKDTRPYMADVLETLKDIQRDGYNKGREEEMIIPSEDVVLLKSSTPENSLDSDFCHSKLDQHKNKTNASN